VSATDPKDVNVTPPPSTVHAGGSTKVLAVITVIIAFGVGLIVGGAGTWAWIIHHHGGRAPFFEALGERRIMRHLDHELDLTPQQHDAIAKIIHERHQRIDAIFGGLRPEVRREIDMANTEIEKLLTPAQRAKFEQARMRLHSRRHMPEGSLPAGPPAP